MISRQSESSVIHSVALLRYSVQDENVLQLLGLLSNGPTRVILHRLHLPLIAHVHAL
jgi:hypothetical protein